MTLGRCISLFLLMLSSVYTYAHLGADAINKIHYSNNNKNLNCATVSTEAIAN